MHKAVLGKRDSVDRGKIKKGCAILSTCIVTGATLLKIKRGKCGEQFSMALLVIIIFLVK